MSGGLIGGVPANARCDASVVVRSFSQPDQFTLQPHPATMNTLYTLLITRLLSWLHGLSSEDFQFALTAVRRWASRTDLTGAEKAKQVGGTILNWLQEEGRELGPAAINVLIELAVSYSRKVK